MLFSVVALPPALTAYTKLDPAGIAPELEEELLDVELLDELLDDELFDELLEDELDDGGCPSPPQAYKVNSIEPVIAVLIFIRPHSIFMGCALSV